MNEDINLITNEEIVENLITYENSSSSIYDIANNIHTILCVLTFTIIIIFLYKVLKNNFSLKK